MQSQIQDSAFAKPPKRFLYRLTQSTVICIARVLFGLRIEGRENVPSRGPFILASNHQSVFDPPLVGSACPREINFAAKIELFRIPIVGPAIRYFNSIPVKRSGFDRAMLQKMIKLLDGNTGVILFPEGTRHPDGILHTPKAGIGMLAVRHPDVQIVPVHIQGTNHILRQILGRTLTVRFGKPFAARELDINDDDRRKSYRIVANHAMLQIAETGHVPPPDFTL